MASQTHPISGSIERVDTTSSQKKNVKKYISFDIEARNISIANIAKQKAVIAYTMGS
jgi:hypothetical protein